MIFPIALISTPWPLFNLPSIQLGTLKAYANLELPQIKIDVHHVYLNIAAALGFDLYHLISERTWLSEAPYATILYPEREEIIKRFWQRQISKKSPLRDVDFKALCIKLKTETDHIIDKIPWDRYRLIGLSICFGQLTSALYFINQVKKKAPQLVVVVGGSACSDEMGRSLLRAFIQIDYVVSGEGELPFVRLINHLSDPGSKKESPSIPGLLSKMDNSHREGTSCSQIPDLDQLPLPDYDDYFTGLESLGPDKVFFPKLPLEISRGCWWRKRAKGKMYSGCAFCNLNIQWEGYRTRSLEKVVSDIQAITEKHQLLSLSFVDNLLPAKNLAGLFKSLSRLGKDLRLFGEIRATTAGEDLEMMARAGVREIQVGIEALSNQLLKKLNKGTTAIQNLEIMKNCEASGFPNLAGNLILNFPGSDETDVKETLANLEFALPFRPLRGTAFWLGYGSPVWMNPDAFGVKGLFNHPFYGHLFPPDILDKLVLIIQGYHGGVRYQQRIWKPVKAGIKRWEAGYAELHRYPGFEPILSYQDGRHFIIIRQRRYGKDDMNHRLQGTSRKIYLFCRKNRSLPEIMDRFPGFGQEKLEPFLKMMKEKRLIFQEGERYLSLAVPIRGWRKK